MLKPVASPPGRLGQFAKRFDRRAAVRFSPFRVSPCFLTSEADGIAVSAWVYNMSALGVGIVGSPWIAPGTQVQLEMINAGYTCVLALEMQVMRVEVASNGGHYIGGQFSRKLTYDELLPFLI